jgi:hypothetical protein
MIEYKDISREALEKYASYNKQIAKKVEYIYDNTTLPYAPDPNEFNWVNPPLSTTSVSYDIG